MSAVQHLSDAWDYDPYTHDRAAWWDHHRALVQAMEPAKWPKRRPGYRTLSDEDVLSIRQRYAVEDVTFLVLAEEYDVTQEAIGYIVRGSTYSSLGGPISDDNIRRGERHADAKLTEKDVADIRRKYAEGGYTHASLAGEYGRGVSTISHILYGLTWKHSA